METEELTREFPCSNLKEIDKNSLNTLGMNGDAYETDTEVINSEMFEKSTAMFDTQEDKRSQVQSDSHHLTFEISDPILNRQAQSEQEDNQLTSTRGVQCVGSQNLPSFQESKPEHSSPECADGDLNDSSQKIVCFVNQDAKVTPSPIVQYVLDADQRFDTVISCADGRVGAHRLVLASASPFIGDMFCSHDHRLGEIAVLVLPDVRMAIMQVLLNLCYTGSMYFPKEDEKEVLDTMKLLLLGEFGDLSIKEVTVKMPPPPAGSSADMENDRVTNQQQHTPIGEEIPQASTSRTNSRCEEDALSTSSSEDEGDETDASNSEHGEVNAAIISTPQLALEEQERLAFANHFLRHKKENVPNEETSINYLLGPKVPGSKTKKLQCYHCPGAFKSLETLTTHLDNNHGIYLQSKKVKKSEFETLTYCTHCNTKHNQIATANHCVSTHSKTRCLICFEIVRIKEFEKHIKAFHAIEQRSGMCIVKCRWCEAGFLLQDPIDNKSMAGHCHSSHFADLKNGNASVDFGPEDEKKVKVLLSPALEKPHKQKGDIKFSNRTPLSENKSKQKEDFKPNVCTLLSEHKTTLKEDVKLKVSTPLLENKNCKSKTPSTPKAGNSEITVKTVPTVLAMLHKASQKRKFIQETDCEKDQPNKKPQKKPRLDSNGKRLQVAKRTGKPIGRQVDIDKLKRGVPSFTYTQKNRSKTMSILMDLNKLPQVYVNINYPKSYIRERIWSVAENARAKGVMHDSYFENKSEQSALDSDAVTEEINTQNSKGDSDPRCSPPCP